MDAATRLYSCDDHLDLAAVPRDVWRSRLPRALAERGPHVVTRDGQTVWLCEDRVLGRSGGSALYAKFSAIGRAGIEDDGYRAGTPRLRARIAAWLVRPPAWVTMPLTCRSPSVTTCEGSNSSATRIKGPERFSQSSDCKTSER